MCVIVESAITTEFAAAEHPFEPKLVAAMLSAMTFQPQPPIATSVATRLLMLTVVLVIGLPRIWNTDAVTSSKVPG